MIINDLSFNGRAKAVRAEFDVAIFLSEELIAIGGGIADNALLKEDADAHLAKQEDLCAMLDNALDTFLDGQRKLNDERRKWIDTKLGPNGALRSARVNSTKVSRKTMKQRK